MSSEIYQRYDLCPVVAFADTEVVICAVGARGKKSELYSLAPNHHSVTGMTITVRCLGPSDNFICLDTGKAAQLAFEITSRYDRTLPTHLTETTPPIDIVDRQPHTLQGDERNVGHQPND